MQGVELKASVRDGFVVVVLRGDLDVTGAADASLRALLRVQTLARRGGGDVVLAAPQPHVLRLLALTGRDEVFCGQASLVAAVAGTGSCRTRYLGGGLRCVLHALGGQPHRIRVPG